MRLSYFACLPCFLIAGMCLSAQQLPPVLSTLDTRWTIRENASSLEVQPHKPSYFLFARYSRKPNQTPRVAAFDGVEGKKQVDYLNLQPTEAKFQMSYKVLIASFMDHQRLALWAAYTQQNAWQVYNSKLSRPFRETNYEPEIIVSWRPQYKALGLDWKMVGVSLNHQSNGQQDPLSRSWNRIIGMVGVERGNLALIAHAWWRIPEKRDSDDNPDMERYLGHGSLVATWRVGEHRLSAMGRLNAATGKGALQCTWSFPVQRRIRAYVQAFSGYGESLIDYNWRQNTIGAGISISDWL